MRNLVFVFSMVIAASAAAAAPRVGGRAPQLAIEKWLKGTPVTRFEPGKVYVIDIWAPWCGPCLGGMQHLTDLQKANAKRGLIVVGMSGPDEYGSTLEKAEKVVSEKGPAIGYAIAWDDAHRNYDTWMALEKSAGWPWSFIVGRDGRIAYIGHPEKLDAVLERVLAGTYDMRAATRQYAGRADALEFAPQFREAYKGNDWPTAAARYEKLLQLDRGVAGPRIGIAYKVYATGLRDDKRTSEFGRRMLRTFNDDADALTTLAETVIELKTHDYELARRAADRAYELRGKGNEPAAALLERIEAARKNNS